MTPPSVPQHTRKNSGRWRPQEAPEGPPERSNCTDTRQTRPNSGALVDYPLLMCSSQLAQLSSELDLRAAPYERSTSNTSRLQLKVEHRAYNYLQDTSCCHQRASKGEWYDHVCLERTGQKRLPQPNHARGQGGHQLQGVNLIWRLYALALNNHSC